MNGVVVFDFMGSPCTLPLFYCLTVYSTEKMPTMRDDVQAATKLPNG